MVLDDLIAVFEIERSEASALFENPYFHHKGKSVAEFKELINDIANVYQWTTEAVKKAILTFPPFAGYDHERVVRRIERLGRLVGKSKEEAREVILKRPRYAGYSAKRYLAAIDIGRKLHAQGQSPELLFRAFSAYYSKSPYVPGTRLRISKIAEYEKPPLMIAMENYNKKPLVRNH